MRGELRRFKLECPAVNCFQSKLITNTRQFWRVCEFLQLYIRHHRRFPTPCPPVLLVQWGNNSSDSLDRNFTLPVVNYWMFDFNLHSQNASFQIRTRRLSHHLFRIIGWFERILYSYICLICTYIIKMYAYTKMYGEKYFMCLFWSLGRHFNCLLNELFNK